MLSQQEIYDQRYAQDGYDNRSKVRVLTRIPLGHSPY